MCDRVVSVPFSKSFISLPNLFLRITAILTLVRSKKLMRRIALACPIEGEATLGKTDAFPERNTRR